MSPIRSDSCKDGRQEPLSEVFEKYGLTEYHYRKALATFRKGGVAALIGNSFPKLTEPFDPEAERMIYVLKNALPWIPATKMVIILQGFGFEIDTSVMRHLYASYGWAQGTKKYTEVDFWAVNLRVANLTQLRNPPSSHNDFFNKDDRLQTLLEVFRLQHNKSISANYPGSRVSLQKHKKPLTHLDYWAL